MLLKKQSSFVLAFFILLILLLPFLNTAIAQETETNQFLPDAPGTTGGAFDLSSSDESSEPNIFLHEKTVPNDTTPDTRLRSAPSAAQTANGKLAGVYEGTVLACPYAFERDLYLNIKGEDVRLLQVLLNSDKRTMIALDGPGSPGKETTVFGQGTKEAVKKFQALFIEYVGVANGRFGPRTRTVMNTICTGTYTAESGQAYNNVPSVQANATPKGEITEIPNDKIAPNISLSANLNTVEAGGTFKVVLNASEEIKPITPDMIIITGGVIKEIRKLSKVSYTISVTASGETKNVEVQIEADRVYDTANNLNEDASNEVVVKVKGSTLAGNTSTSSDINVDIDGLLSKVMSAVPVCNYSPTGLLITINTDGSQVNVSGCAQTKADQQAQNAPTYNCNGANIPITQPCQQQNPYGQQGGGAGGGSKGGGGGMGSMLGNLLKGLGGMGGMGGGGEQNGGGGNGGGGPAAGPQTDAEKAAATINRETAQRAYDACVATEPQRCSGLKKQLDEANAKAAKACGDGNDPGYNDTPGCGGTTASEANDADQGGKPESAEKDKTKDETVGCKYIYIKKGTQYEQIDMQNYSLIHSFDPSKKISYYLFGSTMVEGTAINTSTQKASYDGSGSVFKSDSGTILEEQIGEEKYCCSSKETPQSRGGRQGCGTKKLLTDKLFKAEGKFIKFVK